MVDNKVKLKKANKDEGVYFSEMAREHIRRQMDKRGKGVGVRFSVDKTGCSGLAYVLDYVDAINASDKHFDVDGLSVYIDTRAYPYLKGMSVDYVKEGLNHKFKFENPNQTGQCGCGESFTVDE